MENFTAMGLGAPLLRALEKHGFQTPTEIQAKAIPALMEGKDFIGLAETGTGKTAAFLLPLLNRLLDEPYELAPGQPRGLILAPTRELAQQIGQALNLLSGFIHLRSTVVYGGAPMNKQLNKLKAGVDILIATPGRLMDHVRRGSVQFDRTDIFILDEADRMLDMGFVGDVKLISSSLPEGHQAVMFSATTNKSVDGLTKILMKDPVRVSIIKKASVSKNVAHRVLHLNGEHKRTLLQSILEERREGQAIVFTKTKWGAEKLSRDLARKGLSTDAIHGDRNQRQRQRTLNRFRSGDVDILIATDVAARGIDVPGIACVINFDLPLEAESYVHRVGRTGRNGESGEALSLCAPEDVPLLRDIEHLLKTSIEVDASHPFHQEPPARKAKPKRKRSAGRPTARRPGRRPGGRPSNGDESGSGHNRADRQPGVRSGGGRGQTGIAKDKSEVVDRKEPRRKKSGARAGGEAGAGETTRRSYRGEGGEQGRPQRKGASGDRPQRRRSAASDGQGRQANAEGDRNSGKRGKPNRAGQNGKPARSDKGGKAVKAGAPGKPAHSDHAPKAKPSKKKPTVSKNAGPKSAKGKPSSHRKGRANGKRRAA